MKCNDFLCENHTILRIQARLDVRKSNIWKNEEQFPLTSINKSRKMFYFYPSFSLKFDVSIFCSTIIKQKGSSERNWTGKVFYFYIAMFVKNIKSNSSLPRGRHLLVLNIFSDSTTMPALFDASHGWPWLLRIEECQQSSLSSSVDSRGMEDLHCTETPDVSKCCKLYLNAYLQPK